MNRELLGVILAVLASLSFESAYLLMTQQSRLVQGSGRPGGRFLLSLLHRPLWLLAIALNGAGIVLELFALREVSLIIVQPLMSVGLIGLVFAARVFLGERIDGHTVLAAGALVTGVACVILAAPSDADAVRLGHPLASIVVLGALAAIVISAYVAGGPGVAWRAVAYRADHLRRRSGASGRADGAALPQRLSLGLDMALLLALGLALTGGGAYRLAATARGGPLAAE